MKALKLSAVIFTALLALSACKTAPGENTGGSIDAKLQEGLNDALGKIEGGVTGMNGYQHIEKDEDGLGWISQKTTELYFDAGFTKFSLVQASVYDGTVEMGSDGVSQMVDLNNEIVQKEATAAALSKLTKGASDGYDPTKLTNSDGTFIDDASLGAYEFYKINTLKAQTWASSKVGGNDTWETGTSSNTGFSENGIYFIKLDGAKLYIIKVDIDPVGKSVRFNNDNPLNPSARSTYTKK